MEWLKDDSNGGGTAYSVIRNEDFTEELFGEGPVSPVSHVVVANEWFSKLPPLSHREQTTLNTIPPEEQTPTYVTIQVKSGRIFALYTYTLTWI